MSNNKQTSIYYLWNDLIANPGNYIKAYQKAKAMHKEEMCQFVSDYLDDAADNITAEEYYDQIYGGNNERMV